MKRSLARLGERELARLILNVRRNARDFPLESGAVSAVIELARQEIRRKRDQA
jgi:hypothetical protein